MTEIVDKSDIKIGNGRIDHKGTICCICGSNKTRMKGKDSEGNPIYHWNREYKDDIWSGRYICGKCNDKIRRKLPDSNVNVIKKMRKFRNNQLSIYTSSGKTYVGEQIWCKVRGVKNCNIEKDNFAYKYDHSSDSEYGIVNTKIATLSHHQGSIGAWSFNNRGESKYDTALLLCMDSNMPWKEAKRGYLIPWKEMINRVTITISENPYRGIPWYEKYRIKDIEPYNNAYHSMKLENCNILIDDEVIHWKV